MPKKGEKFGARADYYGGKNAHENIGPFRPEQFGDVAVPSDFNPNTARPDGRASASRE